MLTTDSINMGGTARAAVVALLFAVGLRLGLGAHVVVLVQEDGGEDGAGYFPLAGALSSVVRLAVEHVEEAAATGSPLNVTQSTEEVVNEGISALADLCHALDRDEDTVAVRRGDCASALFLQYMHSTSRQ